MTFFGEGTKRNARRENAAAGSREALSLARALSTHQGDEQVEQPRRFLAGFVEIHTARQRRCT